MHSTAMRRAVVRVGAGIVPLLLLTLCVSVVVALSPTLHGVSPPPEECSASSPRLLPPSVWERLQSQRGMRWRAAPNHLTALSLCEARQLVSQHREMVQRLSLHPWPETKGQMTESKGFGAEGKGQVATLPSHFSALERWGPCIHPILDQGACGSCWAFSASEVLSDMFCIASNGTQDVVLSPQYLTSCDYTNLGCNGGLPPSVWWWMKHKGLVSADCMPYTAGKNGTVEHCLKDNQCKDPSVPFQLYQAKNYTHLFDVLSLKTTCERIMEHIMNVGPVQAGFLVFEDFMAYSSGVYHYVSGRLVGAHAVKVVGWGEENGDPYWLVANSWGTNWGLSGFFKIARCVEECGFEVEVYGGEPLLL